METTYTSLREKIAAEKTARLQRYAGFADLWAKAREAGLAAGNASTPKPMVVHESDLAGRPVGQSWYVSEGACGFAWVTIRPANSSFAKWLAKQGYAQKHYGQSGLCIWISDFNQSIDRKEKCADAMAAVFKDAGIEAYAGSRLD